MLEVLVTFESDNFEKDKSHKKGFEKFLVLVDLTDGSRCSSSLSNEYHIY